jgi:hypothetical protein
VLAPCRCLAETWSPVARASATGRPPVATATLARSARKLAGFRREVIGWAVMADPEDNEFCVERGAAERAQPG